MGARCVGHGGSNAPPPTRFCEANVKSLILTIGASPNLDCTRPVLLIWPPPSFHSHRAPMSLLKDKSEFPYKLYSAGNRNLKSNY